MALPVLKTKLYIPPTPATLVSRPDLVGRLDRGVHSTKVTLISAPAGFGKTTLVSDWIEQASRPVAWVSLDRGDNDPLRFWAHVLAALEPVAPPAGRDALAALRARRAAPASLPPNGIAGWFRPLLVGVINQVATGNAASFVLVLDDLHTVTEQHNHDLLLFLIEHQPPSMHLILSTRADPPWPMARLRARREITELRSHDLRFTAEQAAAFMAAATGLDLSAEHIASLEARTEGWIAGLQMAALSMRGRGADHVASFIEAFSGSHRFVLDYLVEEVLDRQPPEVRSFLLQSSLLDQLSAPLCSALSGMPESECQAMLRRLERANLFLAPLDDERRWYRYHHLFADLLRRLQAQRQEGHAPDLHRKASHWYQEQGLHAEALEHALQSGDVDWAATLVRENALAMMEHGELADLKALLDALPDETVGTHPWLCIARAWLLLFTGPHQDLAPLLARAQSDPAQTRSRAEQRALEGHIAAIRSGLASIRGDLPRAAWLGRAAMELLPEQDAMARGWSAANLALALYWSGDLQGAEEAYRQAAQISRARRQGYVSVMCTCNVAVTQTDRGQLHRAAETFREAISLARAYEEQSGQPLHVVGYAEIYVGGILYEWNQLDAALSRIREGIAHCVRWGEPQLLASGHARLARALWAVGDREGAQAAMRQAEEAASGLSPWYIQRIAAERVELYLAQGQVQAAARHAAGWQSLLLPEGRLDFRYEMIYRAQIRLLLAQGSISQALDLSARALELVAAVGAHDLQIKTLILRAAALQRHDEKEAALQALEKALALGEPEGYTRSFMSDDPHLRAVLARAATAHAARLRALIAPSTAPSTRPGPAQAPAPAGLIEPLSEREQQILRLLTSHLSSSEIAQELYISPHTVRSHTKHIYEKLDVHSRAQAVERAQELGLL